jgi:hypothetical protein
LSPQIAQVTETLPLFFQQALVVAASPSTTLSLLRTTIEHTIVVWNTAVVQNGETTRCALSPPSFHRALVENILNDCDKLTKIAPVDYAYLRQLMLNQIFFTLAHEGPNLPSTFFSDHPLIKRFTMVDEVSNVSWDLPPKTRQRLALEFVRELYAAAAPAFASVFARKAAREEAEFPEANGNDEGFTQLLMESCWVSDEVVAESTDM